MQCVWLEYYLLVLQFHCQSISFAILHRLAGTTPPGGQNVSWTCDHCISSQTTSPCSHIVSWIIRSTVLTRSHTKTYHNLRWFNRVIIYGVGHLSVMSWMLFLHLYLHTVLSNLLHVINNDEIVFYYHISLLKFWLSFLNYKWLNKWVFCLSYGFICEFFELPKISKIFTVLRIWRDMKFKHELVRQSQIVQSAIDSSDTVVP